MEVNVNRPGELVAVWRADQSQLAVLLAACAIAAGSSLAYLWRKRESEMSWSAKNFSISESSSKRLLEHRAANAAATDCSLTSAQFIWKILRYVVCASTNSLYALA